MFAPSCLFGVVSPALSYLETVLACHQRCGLWAATPPPVEASSHRTEDIAVVADEFALGDRANSYLVGNAMYFLCATFITHEAIAFEIAVASPHQTRRSKRAGFLD
jgi:hypothetical protein